MVLLVTVGATDLNCLFLSYKPWKSMLQHSAGTRMPQIIP